MIPSYDDLTPSIPDVGPREVLSAAAAVVPSDGGPAVQAARGSSGAVPASALFAALGGWPADRLAAIGRDFSPRLERFGDEVVLDIAGLQRLLGDAPAIAAALAHAGVPRVAVASTYTAARLLVRARPGVTVAGADPDAAVRDLPLAVLKALTAADRGGTPGGALYRPRARRALPAEEAIGRAFDVLERWGLTTLGELAALPAGPLAARLGACGRALQALARGCDPRPLVPDPGVRRFVGTCELEWPVENLEPLSFVFARVLEPLAVALEQEDRGAVALHLTLRLTDRTAHVRTLGLPAAMRDARVLRTLVLLDLESHPPSAPVDAVSIELDPAPARIVQHSLLERALPAPETLATLMARLTALVGEARCGSPRLLDTHKPDAFEMGPCAFDTGPAASVPPARKVRCHVDPLGGQARAPRPDGPAGGPQPPPAAWSGTGSCTLRRFRPPVAVRVATDGGRPARVAIDRRGMPGGAVTQSAGPWRTSGGWWDVQRWDRDEWDVALSDGSVCRLFRDRDAGGWFLDGVFD